MSGGVESRVGGGVAMVVVLGEDWCLRQPRMGECRANKPAELKGRQGEERQEGELVLCAQGRGGLTGRLSRFGRVTVARSGGHRWSLAIHESSKIATTFRPTESTPQFRLNAPYSSYPLPYQQHLRSGL
jgi:hypothetical protein